MAHRRLHAIRGESCGSVVAALEEQKATLRVDGPQRETSVSIDDAARRRITRGRGFDRFGHGCVKIGRSAPGALLKVGHRGRAPSPSKVSFDHARVSQGSTNTKAVGALPARFGRLGQGSPASSGRIKGCAIGGEVADFGCAPRAWRCRSSPARFDIARRTPRGGRLGAGANERCRD